jgi:hypothetical protein
MKEFEGTSFSLHRILQEAVCAKDFEDDVCWVNNCSMCI